MDAANPLHHESYPRSNTYDPQWVFDNQMGPNALWLMESLSTVVPLEPGMRVLDLGCGKAMTSIFLAREFGVHVWATDLWIDASSNQGRIRAAGVDALVTATHAEAHQLPFAEGFFDAIVSVDAFLEDSDLLDSVPTSVTPRSVLLCGVGGRALRGLVR